MFIRGFVYANMKKVMVFGVFDRLHSGHLHFLREAKGYGELVVVVARDSAVLKLKKRRPAENEQRRIKSLKKLLPTATVVLGDQVRGSYDVIKKYKPDIICLGYDQNLLESDLKEKINEKLLSKLELVNINSHKPKELHSSLLNFGVSKM